MDPLGYFALGVIASYILKMLAQVVNRAIIVHRQEKLIRMLKVSFPDNTSIKFVATGSTDRRVFNRLKAQIIEAEQLNKDDLEAGGVTVDVAEPPAKES